MTRYFAVLRKHARRGALGLLASVSAGIVVALSSGPAAAHPAGAPGIGCAHNHVPGGLCVLNLQGGACVTARGQAGICVYIRRAGQQPPPGVCDCVNNNVKGSQIAALDTMQNVVQIGADSKKATSVVGKDAVCAQLNALTTSFMEAHKALDLLQPFDMYHPDFLGQIDFVATNWNKFASAARSCGIDLPADEIANTLQRTKQEISDNAASFLGLLDAPCSIGAFSAVHNFSFSVTSSPTCGIGSFGINASGCPVVVQNFGANGNVQFSLKSGATNTIQASGLTILGQPGHTCEMTLTQNGSTQVSLVCMRTGGSCSDTFIGFGGP